MPQYIGFSTKDACLPKNTNDVSGYPVDNSSRNRVIWGKKFRLLDAKLVIQDFINSINIPLGSKVGQPGYGSKVWSFIFEPNTADIQFQLENEIRRLANQDPRIILNYVKAFPQENGILMEVEIAINPFNVPQTLSVFFNQATNVATLI
jgi:hypothetical protein